MDSAELLVLIRKYFPENQWNNALRVAQAESGLNPNAHNQKGEDSRGLFQINVVPAANPKYKSVNLFDPETNVRAASELYKAAGWRLWTTAVQMGIVGTTDSTPPVEAKKAGNKMLRIAVIPSCQLAWDEKAQMDTFAPFVVSALNRYKEIESRVFYGTGERDEEGLPHLVEQLEAAYRWLDEGLALGMSTLSLNLHSDSGTSHVNAYFGNADITKRLAVALLDTLAEVTALKKTTPVNYEKEGYLIWSKANGHHCPVLLECGSHVVATDVGIFRSKAVLISTALAARIISFFSLPTAVYSPAITLDAEKVATFFHWGLACIAAGEDPRNLEKFVKHLHDSNRDYRFPDLYGWPA